MTAARRRFRTATAAVALLGSLGAAGAASAADAARGKAIYETRCSPCHGMNGSGDGPAAAAITPPPRNFRAPDFWRGRTTQQLILTVKDGRPGTLMAPFAGVLSPTEIEDVVAYVESLRPPR